MSSSLRHPRSWSARRPSRISSSRPPHPQHRQSRTWYRAMLRLRTLLRETLRNRSSWPMLPSQQPCSSADGDGSPTGGDGSPADGSPADGSPTDGDGSPTDGDGSSANGDGSSRAGTYRPIPSAPGGCVDESIDLRADSGAIGEHLAQKKNPRIQMGQAPQMMQAPVAQAPVGAAPQGALAYAPMGYGAAPAAPQGFMGYMAVPGGGPPSGYGYGYGFGPPPGQGYGPGPGYPPCPPYPQGPPEGYPQGPPPVAPSPQGSNHWWGGHAQYNSSAQQQQPPNVPDETRVAEQPVEVGPQEVQSEARAQEQAGYVVAPTSACTGSTFTGTGRAFGGQK